MKTTTRMLLSLALAGAIAHATDPRLLSLVMPDARVAFGIDISRMRSSPFSQSVSSGIHEAEPEIRKLMEAAGFDPLRDLQELLIVSTGAPKDPPVLIIARGAFDLDKLRAFAQTAGSKVVTHQGIDILTDPEKKSGGFALLDNNLIVAGNLEQLRAAIERRARGGIILNPELATKIESLGSRYDAWLVSTAPLGPLASSLPQEGMEGLAQAGVLKGVEQFSMGIGLSYDLTLATEIVTRTDKDAGAIADAVQMILGMAQKKLQDQPAAAEALKSLDFGVDGRSVHLAFTVPQAEVQKAIQSAWDARKPTVTVAAKQAAPAPQAEQVIAAAPTVLQPVEASAARDVVEPKPAQPPADVAPPAPAAPRAGAPVSVRRLPANTEILIQSSPKDMGTVVIVGGKK